MARSAVLRTAHSDSAHCIVRFLQRFLCGTGMVSLVDSAGLRHLMLLKQADVALIIIKRLELDEKLSLDLDE